MNKKESFANMHKRSKTNYLRYPDVHVGAYFSKNNWNNVLDFGCGNGRHTQMLCELAKEKYIDIVSGRGGAYICVRFRRRCA